MGLQNPTLIPNPNLYEIYYLIQIIFIKIKKTHDWKDWFLYYIYNHDSFFHNAVICTETGSVSTMHWQADASQGHHVKKKRQTLFMCCNFQACIQREGVPSRAFSSLFKITLSVHPLIGGTEIRCQGMPPCCLQQQAICNNAFPPKVFSLSLSLPSFLPWVYVLGDSRAPIK